MMHGVALATVVTRFVPWIHNSQLGDFYVYLEGWTAMALVGNVGDTD